MLILRNCYRTIQQKKYQNQQKNQQKNNDELSKGQKQILEYTEKEVLLSTEEVVCNCNWAEGNTYKIILV